MKKEKKSASPWLPLKHEVKCRFDLCELRQFFLFFFAFFPSKKSRLYLTSLFFHRIKPAVPSANTTKGERFLPPTPRSRSTRAHGSIAWPVMDRDGREMGTRREGEMSLTMRATDGKKVDADGGDRPTVRRQRRCIAAPRPFLRPPCLRRLRHLHRPHRWDSIAISLSFSDDKISLFYFPRL